MIIKPRMDDVMGIFGVLFLLICLIICHKNVTLGAEIGVFTLILISLFYYVFSFPVCMRTLIFDEHGCTIKLLKNERFYRWDELVIKKQYKFNRKERIYFSIDSDIPLEKFWYMIFLHPFTCFYITLIDMEKFKANRGKRTTPPLAACDKEEFLSKIEEWGVCIDMNS